MLNNIQLLRAIAALLVVMHHVRQSYLQMGGKNIVIEKIGYFGVAGVDIFFVISGFVIALTISHSKPSFYSALEYLKNRFFRIYLGYWPAFFVMLGVNYFFVYTPQWGKIDLVNSFTLLPIDPAQGKKPLLDVYWTLTFELYFYTLCLFAFFVPRRIFNAGLLIYFIGITAKNILAPDHNHYTLLGFVTSFFILEFIAGWFLYQYRHILLHHLLPPLLIIGLIISVTSGIFLDARNQLIRASTFGVAGIFLVILCFWFENRNNYKAGRWLTQLGDASYAIYLYHIPLMILFSYWGIWQKHSSTQLDMPDVAVVVFLALLCSLCMLYYDNIEKPLYRAACKKASFDNITS